MYGSSRGNANFRLLFFHRSLTLDNGASPKVSELTATTSPWRAAGDNGAAMTAALYISGSLKKKKNHHSWLANSEINVQRADAGLETQAAQSSVDACHLSSATQPEQGLTW